MDVYTVADLPDYPFAARLGVAEGMRAARHDTVTFTNGNRLVRLFPDPAAAEAALVVAYARASPGEVLLEVALLVDALRRAHRGRITCLFPYLPYSRSHRAGEQGVAFGARVFASLVDAAGVDDLIFFDLHAAELAGFFRTPVRTLSALPELATALRREGGGWDWVLAPDCGRYAAAMALARSLDAEPDFFVKCRADHSGRSALVPTRRPHLAGARVLLFDDEVTTGGTLVNAVRAATAEGAASIDLAVLYSFCTTEVLLEIGGAGPVRSFTTTDLALPPGAAALPFSYRVLHTSALAALAAREGR